MALNFPNDEVFLTTEEVLEYLQVNLRTVYRLIKAGKIPAVRVGRQWRIRKTDIEDWLATQEAGARLGKGAIGHHGGRAGGGGGGDEGAAGQHLVLSLLLLLQP